MSASPAADLAISSGSQTHIWHAPGLRSNSFTVLKNAGSVKTSRWNQNNKVVVTAGQTGQLVLNYINGTVMGVLPPDSAEKLPPINTVCFSKGSKYLATGCDNGQVFIWNLKRQVIMWHFTQATNLTVAGSDCSSVMLIRSQIQCH